MLLCIWSPKGGSGVSVFAAACALTLAREGHARLADLGGDQPTVLGLDRVTGAGLREWLAVGAEAPVDALDRIAFDAGGGLTLLGAGEGELATLAPEAGAALGVALRASSGPTVADVGVPGAPPLDALLEVADASVVVVRGCYVALRRASCFPATARAAGAVLLAEPGRALGARDVADVLGVPVLARVPVHSSIARVVDAGVLRSRLPEALARPARELLARLGCTGRQGRAA